jgi:2-methylisocitrate lyase-like PEP mutase family enzyme
MTTVAGGDRGGLAERAEALRRLHRSSRPLVLPNAWDVASARLVVKAGFPVVATSSGAVAATLGYEDNDSMPVASHHVSEPVASRIRGGELVLR